MGIPPIQCGRVRSCVCWLDLKQAVWAGPPDPGESMSRIGLRGGRGRLWPWMGKKITSLFPLPSICNLAFPSIKNVGKKPPQCPPWWWVCHPLTSGIFIHIAVTADTLQYHLCSSPLQNDASYQTCCSTTQGWKFPLCRRVLDGAAQLQVGVIQPPNGQAACSHTGDSGICSILSTSLKRVIWEPWTSFRTPSKAIFFLWHQSWVRDS